MKLVQHMYEDLQQGFSPQAQPWPGLEKLLKPTADHGEKTYVGSGKLKSCVALITGGDSGIGRAVAIAYAREGADVAIAYYNEEEDAEETAHWIEEAGRRTVRIPGDLSDPDRCQAAVDRVCEELGQLNILVNNAAYQKETASFQDITVEQLERTFRTNILAYIWMAQAAIPRMCEAGRIINTGSVTALEGDAALLDYAATKAAIHSFTKSLAESVAEQGIRVNCVAPGPVWTPLIPSTLSEEHVKRFGLNTYWHRAAQPAEIAPTYVYLASSDSQFMTGEIIAVTGRGTTR